MRKLAAISGVAGALAAMVVVYCPSAAANPACPYDMNTQAGRDAFQQAIVASSQQVSQNQQAYGPNGNLALATEDINSQRNMSNVILACQGIDSPALAPLPPAPQPLPDGVDPGMAAIRATGNPMVGQAPDCAYYADKVSQIPPGVDVATFAAGLPGGSDVLIACGLANSVLGGLALTGGDIPEFLDRGQQANIGMCEAGRGLIPGITDQLPECR